MEFVTVASNVFSPNCHVQYIILILASSYFTLYDKILLYTFKSEFLPWCFQNYSRSNAALSERGDCVCRKDLRWGCFDMVSVRRALCFFCVWLHPCHPALSSAGWRWGLLAGSTGTVFQQPSFERFAVAGELSFTESLGLNRVHPIDKVYYLLSFTLDLWLNYDGLIKLFLF